MAESALLTLLKLYVHRKDNKFNNDYELRNVFTVK